MQRASCGPCLLLVVALVSLAAPAEAQEDRPGAPAPALSAGVVAQINALQADKLKRTPAQRKINSRLLHAMHLVTADTAALRGLPRMPMAMPMVDGQRVWLDVRAEVTPDLVEALRALGAEVTDVSARYRHIGLKAPFTILDAIAAVPEVEYVAPELGGRTASGRLAVPLRMISGPLTRAADVDARAAARARVADQLRGALHERSASQSHPIRQVGSVNSQGDATHRAAEARSTFGVTGAGVKIGVLSDGVASLAASQSNGDLGPVTVVSGQAGSGDEGTAMLEIVHDLAPGATLYFATAITGAAQFATNIAALRSAGCDIIVDDVSYLQESPFQDGQTGFSTYNSGIVAQAVKDAAASGALYFSSAANSGRKDAGTSGTYEGDFTDGGTTPLTGAARAHDFGGGLLYDTLTASGDFFNSLYWTDPLGASANDYDLYLVNSTGTSVIDFSNDMQDGTQDPFEFLSAGVAGNRLVVVRVSGSNRFFHLSTNRGTLSVSTGGETHGHAATTAANTYSVAATPACGGAGSTGPCSTTFGASHKVETFSSDGFRRLFFNGNGTAITPGNVGSSGGLVLAKPDITAADGVSTSVPGFTSFFGTSAAAPHAAAIAGLVKSKNLAMTAAQVSAAMTSTAIDIEQAGVDRNSGYGIVMAFQAVQAAPAGSGAAAAPTITLHPAPTTTVLTGEIVSLSTSASGSPSPTPQWQVSVDGGASWTNLAGATGPNLSFAAQRTDNGRQYRCVYTNASGTAATNAAALVVRLRVRADLDGDRKADLVLWRPGTGQWFWLQSSSANSPSSARSKQWGNNGFGDVPLSGDMDGDGRMDLVVWRASTGTWFWLTSSTSYDYDQSRQVQWGNNSLGDIPMIGDIDGDGKGDLIVWRASDGTWYWLLSSAGYNTSLAGSKQWGNSGLGDQPLLGDMDGDGLADFTVWRASDGTWYWLTSSSNYSYTSAGLRQWGNNGLGDIPLLNDIDGDGVTDLVVWRASTGTWYWLTATSGYDYALADSRQWGIDSLGDVPMLGDLDGDGRADLIVWRNSDGTWHWLPSLGSYNVSGQQQNQWGTAGDKPLIK